MSGSRIGGLKAAQTNRELYGDNFYKKIGKIGGEVLVPKGFALDRDRARTAGVKAGKASRRTGIKAGQGTSRSAIKRHRDLDDRMDQLRIEKPRWYQWSYRRKLKRLGVK